MLTAKVGNSTINCFDGKYDRHRLKEWSNKGVLKCPVCNSDYEYCHGEVVSPYFRHVGKECDGYYSEPETNEHRNGKLMLYNWIKNQDGISNCKLESWIPETKQRPDIYFEFNEKKFVIEFQCTPIASEYLKRRELYKLAGINDIWILGVEKYSIHIDKKGNPYHEKRHKTIEKELKSNGLIYFDVKKRIFICDQAILVIDNELKNYIDNTFYKSNMNKFNLFDKYYMREDYYFIEFINNFDFNENKIEINNEIKKLLEIVKNYYFQESEKVDKEKKILEEKVKKAQEKIKQMKDKLNEVENSSEYVGVIGEKITLPVLLVEEIYFRTYDSSLYKFIDEKGNVLTWMTSTCPDIDLGDYLEITGKVKSQTKYDDSKQTRLIRCEIGMKVKQKEE